MGCRPRRRPLCHLAFLCPFQAPPALWGPRGSQGSPRGSPSSQGQWVHTAREAPRGPRERWGPRAPLESQVGAPFPAGLSLPFPPRMPLLSSSDAEPGRSVPGAHTPFVAVQVSAGLPGRQGPREEAACLPFPGSEETRGPWDSRAPSARKVSDTQKGQRARPFFHVCR